MFGSRRCSEETANGRREMNVYCNDVTIADDRVRLARNKDGEGRKLQLRGDGRGGVCGVTERGRDVELESPETAADERRHQCGVVRARRRGTGR